MVDETFDLFDESESAQGRDRAARKMLTKYFDACEALAKARGREFSDADRRGVMEAVHALGIEGNPRELVILLASHFAAAPARDAIGDAVAAAKTLHEQSAADAKSWLEQAQEVSTELVRKAGEAVDGAVAKHITAVNKALEDTAAMGVKVTELGGEVGNIKGELRTVVTDEIEKSRVELRAMLAAPVDEFVEKMRGLDRKADETYTGAVGYQVQRLEETARRLRQTSRSWFGVAAFAVLFLVIGVVFGKIFS